MEPNVFHLKIRLAQDLAVERKLIKIVVIERLLQ